MDEDIVQGDNFHLKVFIKNDGRCLNLDKIERIEFTIHNIKKTYPEEVTFSDDAFYVPITQEESFSLPPMVEMQIRVKFTSGEIIGSKRKRIDVERSLSKEIL